MGTNGPILQANLNLEESLGTYVAQYSESRAEL
jgi:hypothetical protein